MDPSTDPSPDPSKAHSQSGQRPETTPPRAVNRLAIGFNVLSQVVLFTAIIMMVNYVNFRHFKRWDFSRNQKYALAPLTKNLLSGLKKPVKAVVFFPGFQAIAQDVSALLREYEYASDKKLTVELVDPYRNLLRAKELSEKYKFGSSDNIVILDCEGKSKFVNASDMADMDNSGAMFGQAPAVRSFKGEEALTSALLEITEEKQSKLYFLTGHGEPAPSSEDLSALKGFIDRQNIKLDPLNLNNVDNIPEDASAVVLLGPKADLSEGELKLLSDYWMERNGRLFLALPASTKTPKIAAWLASLGVSLQQDVVVKSGTMLVLQGGQPTIRNGIITNAVGFTPPSTKNVLKDAAGFDMQFAGLTQSLTVDSAKAAGEKIRSQPLITTTPDYWGETEYNASAEPQAVKDLQKDHAGPLSLGLALERGGIQDPRVKVQTARMILVGNAAFLSNEGLRASETGLDFAINSINWLINREQLAGIPPKAKQAVSLSLTEYQMSQVALCVMCIIPGIAALLGTLVWWRRRH
jgi:ABC-type uncharacterized transport system